MGLGISRFSFKSQRRHSPTREHKTFHMSLFLSTCVSLMNFKKKSRCNLCMNMQDIRFSLSLKIPSIISQLSISAYIRKFLDACCITTQLLLSINLINLIHICKITNRNIKSRYRNNICFSYD